jgi:intracellular multiplication protein IcmN
MIGIRVWGNVIFLMAMVSLTACSSQTSSTSHPIRHEILADGLVDNYSASQKTLFQNLRKRKIHIVEVGEQVTLILPADKFFQPCSPAISAYAYPMLNDIALLLRTFPKTSVVITGYTDNLGSSQRNVALSRQRAQATADYLWSQDVDTRLLYTEGKGSDEPLADNSSLKGQQWNRRIEITFQHLKE